MSQWKVTGGSYDSAGRGVFTVTKGSACLDHREQDELEALLAGWVSVDDRLPQSNDWYLVAAITEAPGGGERIATMAFFDSGLEFGQPLWLTHNDTESGEWNGVSHWMPLPEPPTN